MDTPENMKAKLNKTSIYIEEFSIAQLVGAVENIAESIRVMADHWADRENMGLVIEIEAIDRSETEEDHPLHPCGEC